MARKYADSPSGRNGGPIMRIGSPPSGSSILITSAPRSASSIEPYGPASMRERSRTRTPSKSFTLSPRMLAGPYGSMLRSEEHTSELQSHHDLVCRLLLEKKKKKQENQ